MKTVQISEEHFRTLHSAARALYVEVMKTENHSPASLAFINMLNDAIDAGHEVLGTDRVSADRYIEATKEVTRQQHANAQMFVDKYKLQETE